MVSEKFAKANFVAAFVLFAAAFVMVPLGANPDYRIAAFYLGVLCIAAGLFFRAGGK